MGYHVCSGSVSLVLHPLELKPFNYYMSDAACVNTKTQRLFLLAFAKVMLLSERNNSRKILFSIFARKKQEPADGRLCISFIP